jgi:hypothetical protein
MQARNIKNGEREPKANDEQSEPGDMVMEGTEVEKDVTISETTAEIEMGATASNE